MAQVPVLDEHILQAMCGKRGSEPRDHTRRFFNSTGISESRIWRSSLRWRQNSNVLKPNSGLIPMPASATGMTSRGAGAARRCTRATVVLPWTARAVTVAPGPNSARWRVSSTGPAPNWGRTSTLSPGASATPSTSAPAKLPSNSARFATSGNAWQKAGFYPRRRNREDGAKDNRLLPDS